MATLLGHMVAKIGVDNSGLISGLNKADRRFDSFTRDSMKAIKSITGTVFSLKTALVGLASSYALKEIATGFIDVGSSVDKMKLSLDTITKGKGDQWFARLNKWASEMPINTEKAIQAFTSMRAMGMKPAIEDMTVLVDTVSALGGGSDVLSGIARALGQIQTKGKVATQELYQLAERGVPAMEILQQELGLTADQIGDIGSQGVKAGGAIEALLKGMSDRFGGMSAKIMNTWAGMVEQMQDSWYNFRKDVMAAGVMPALEAGLKSVIDRINELKSDTDKYNRFIAGVAKTSIKAFAGMVRAIGNMAVAFAEVKIAAQNTLGFILTMIKVVVDSINKLQTYMTGTGTNVAGSYVYSSGNQELIDQFEAAKKAAEEQIPVLEELSEWLDKVAFSMVDGAINSEELKQKMKALREETNSVANSIEAFTENIEYTIAANNGLIPTIEKIKTEYLAVEDLFKNDYFNDLKTTYVEDINAFGPQLPTDEWQKWYDDITERHEHFLNSIQDLSADTLYDLMTDWDDGWKGVWKNALDYANHYFSEVSANYFTSEISSGGEYEATPTDIVGVAWTVGTMIGNLFKSGDSGPPTVNFQSTGLYSSRFGGTSLPGAGGAIEEAGYTNEFMEIRQWYVDTLIDRIESAGLTDAQEQEIWNALYDVKVSYPSMSSVVIQNEQDLSREINEYVRDLMTSPLSSVISTMISGFEEEARIALQGEVWSEATHTFLEMTEQISDIQAATERVNEVFGPLETGIMEAFGEGSQQHLDFLDMWADTISYATDQIKEATAAEEAAAEAAKKKAYAANLETATALQMMIGGSSAQDIRLAQIANRYGWSDLGLTTMGGGYNWSAIQSYMMENIGGITPEWLESLGDDMDQVVSDMEYVAEYLLGSSESLSDSATSLSGMADDWARMQTNIQGIIAGYTYGNASQLSSYDRYFLAQSEFTSNMSNFPSPTSDASGFFNWVENQTSLLQTMMGLAQETWQRPSIEYGNAREWIMEALTHFEEVSGIYSEIDIQIEQRDLLQEIADNTAGNVSTVTLGVTNSGTTGTWTGSGTGSNAIALDAADLINRDAFYTDDSGRTILGSLLRQQVLSGSYDIEDWTPAASGIWDVPYDNFPTLAHKHELIMPAKEAEKFRSGQGGGGDVNIELTINAPGANGQGIAREVQKVLPYLIQQGKSRRAVQKVGRYS